MDPCSTKDTSTSSMITNYQEPTTRYFPRKCDPKIPFPPYVFKYFHVRILSDYGLDLCRCSNFLGTTIAGLGFSIFSNPSYFCVCATFFSEIKLNFYRHKVPHTKVQYLPRYIEPKSNNYICSNGTVLNR